MGDHLKKVQTGDPLRIPARAYNAFVDAARDLQGRQQEIGGATRREFRQTGIVLVKNSSGADRDRFDVLGVDGVIFTPTDNLDEFKNQVVLKGITPAEDDHLGRFVVLLEPLADGEIGRACVDGVCPARIDVQDADDRFADVKDADAASLLGGAFGAASILWKEDGTGVKWAVVRIGEEPAVPLGVIVMWSGSVADIPAGWTLCDGTVANGLTTPDLRGRFILGLDEDDAGGDGDESSIGDTGGYRWHGIAENNHPDHLDHVHWKGTPIQKGQAGTTEPHYYGVYTDVQTNPPSGEGGLVQRHGGIVHAWTGGEDPEVHSYNDTDPDVHRDPRYYVLAFIMRTR